MKDIAVLPLCSFNQGQDIGKHTASVIIAKSTGNLLTVFALSEVAFAYVVGECDINPFQKQPVILSVILQPVQ